MASGNPKTSILDSMTPNSWSCKNYVSTVGSMKNVERALSDERSLKLRASPEATSGTQTQAVMARSPSSTGNRCPDWAICVC
jgi:hypothetical protein